VFPHSVVVSLLGCPKLLRYKKGPRVERLEAFASYQALMQAFARLRLGRPCAERLDAVLGANASLLRGKALKAHEDRLDAVACALVAWVAFCQGAAGLEVFGDASDGYITAPALHAVRGGHAHQAEDACEGDLRGEHEAQARFR
jgi:predicted RNase H-like nuclease